jgi:glycine hydroxymethyltransferase
MQSLCLIEGRVTTGLALQFESRLLADYSLLADMSRVERGGGCLCRRREHGKIAHRCLWQITTYQSGNPNMFSAAKKLGNVDPALWQAIEDERHRQDQHIELIASENYTSPAVMQAQGSQLTNKYAEGYPGKRFYGGCEYVDQVEQIAIDRVNALFGAEYANVQPHSGSQANQAVYFSILKPGDTIMGMNLGHGGHLTHGSPANLSGKLFNIVAYGLNDKEEIDYDEMERIALENNPKLLIGGASAYALRFDWARMAEIAKKVGAYFMVDMAHYSGLIAAGVYPNPVPHADFVTSTTHKTLRGPRGGIILAKAEYEKTLNSSVFPSLQGGPLMHVIAGKAVAFLEASQPEFKAYQEQVLKNAVVLAQTLAERGLRIISGRTESHMFMVDLRPKGLTGKAADAALGLAHITVNKNAIPNDPESPFVTSGIRIGSPAITTRGFKEEEARLVANLIADVLDNPADEAVITATKAKVHALTGRFPVYGA